jgi:hypothetical protein
MADGQNAKPRTRSPLSPSAFEFLPTFHREGVSKLFVSAKTAGAIPVLSPAIGDALVLASLDAKVRSIGFIASARRGKEHVDLDVVVVQRGDRLFFMDVVAARRIRDLEDEGFLRTFRVGIEQRGIVERADVLEEDQTVGCLFEQAFRRYGTTHRLLKGALRVSLMRGGIALLPRDFAIAVEALKALYGFKENLFVAHAMSSR